MSSRKYPAKGAQAKRKADGLAGACVCEQPEDGPGGGALERKDETGTLLYDAEQFASEWEAGESGRREVENARGSDCIGGDGGDRDLLRGDGVEVICGEQGAGGDETAGERGGGWEKSARK